MKEINTAKIKAFLLRMQEEDPEYRMFGSEAHKYRLGSLLAEDQLQEFERKHGVALPPDCRRFLNEVGDGSPVRSSARVIAVNAGAGIETVSSGRNHAEMRSQPSLPVDGVFRNANRAGNRTLGAATTPSGGFRNRRP